eukprot:scaffold177350_cov23-Prasinocladus_malaysianus.AAC.1
MCDRVYVHWSLCLDGREDVHGDRPEADQGGDLLRPRQLNQAVGIIDVNPLHGAPAPLQADRPLPVQNQKR